MSHVRKATGFCKRGDEHKETQKGNKFNGHVRGCRFF